MSATRRSEFIVDRSSPGSIVGRAVTLDPRIVIDARTHDVLWTCDHCGGRSPVTAEYKVGRRWITLCATCLQHGLNGIALSLSRPEDQP